MAWTDYCIYILRQFSQPPFEEVVYQCHASAYYLTVLLVLEGKENKLKDMKIKSVMAALLLMAVGLQTLWAQKMVVTMADDSKVEYDILQVKDITFEEVEKHDWVDLGLPSGTLWATCNVGANSPEEYGDYFAWGETEPKDEYNWSTYKYCKGSANTITKYCQRSELGDNGFTDTLTELLPEDDAATANWGSGWQMPNIAQIQELVNSVYTTTEWTTQNGVNGRRLTSKSNGNSIFLPAAGYRSFDGLGGVGSWVVYWSSSLDPSFSFAASFLYFSSSEWGLDGTTRNDGYSVRPVRVKN